MPKRKKNGKRKNVEGFTQNIIELFRKDRSNGFNYKQISAKLGVNDASSRNHIIKTLKNLQSKGTLQEIERGKFILTPSMNYHTGVLDINTRGQGYVMVEGMEDDIFIKNKHLNKGLKGDVVEVYVFKRRRSGKIEGEVTKILERKRKEFVGIITVSDRFAFVECVGYNMYTDIFIPKSKINKAQNGDKVLVKMVGWDDPSSAMG